MEESKSQHENTGSLNNTTPKVTGIGGIFFKCKDPSKMKEWYKTHLRLDTTDYGATFEWRDDEDPTKKVLQHGVHLQKRRNILNLQQKTS